MRRCKWCRVRLRWWQLGMCERCLVSQRVSSHHGRSAMWCPKGSRRDAERDRWGVSAEQARAELEP